jgi:chromosome segregation ATPase
MNGLSQDDAMTSNSGASRRVKIKMLYQMAEALEDEAAGMYRRAAMCEEEEFSLNHEIEEWQTQINRLLLKLEGLRAERESINEKIESLKAEAAALREEAFAGEEEIAIASIASRAEEENHSRGSMYFRRMTLANHARG